MKIFFNAWTWAFMAGTAFIQPPVSAQMILNTLPMDGYAAVVNERIITIGDVMMSIYEAHERLRTRYGGEELESRRHELFLSGLEKLIEQNLILEEFEDAEGQIPDRAIDDRINDIIFESFGNDRSELLSALAKDGITLEEWRETIRERIIISAMRRNVIGDKVIISPRQILDAYSEQQNRFQQPEQVRLSLIFLKQGEDSEKTLEKITETRESILDGKLFADAAREVSGDSSAAAGGDWGWVQPADLRDELKNAITNLPTNQISEIIYTSEGLYLLQVEEHKQSYTKTLEEVRLEIESELKEKEGERLYKAWMERLRNKHSILYYIPTDANQS